MTDAGTEYADLTRWFADRVLTGLGESTPDRSRLRIVGDPDLRTPLPFLDLAAASFASVGLAAERLLAAVGFAHAGGVSVDRQASAVWFDVPFAPSRFLDVTEHHGSHAPWMAEFETADDRWIISMSRAQRDKIELRAIAGTWLQLMNAVRAAVTARSTSSDVAAGKYPTPRRRTGRSNGREPRRTPGFNLLRSACRTADSNQIRGSGGGRRSMW